ncbi:APC family permease (plasmid) [Nicoliella spurrieriana]|uniref:APC family permease n=1 Tax=Nicoliella spurrieriana TaxID=2925830 RepID=A0A976RQP8_9LACO|nr:APC family permease [Nicoliella spurrieriana]UQS86033.1 APC family permease [Nicoliella spurrieriana]
MDEKTNSGELIQTTYVDEHEESNLKPNSLSFFEVIGESIANIAPTATPVMNIAVVFALAGNSTWIAYLFATVACILLAKQINVFAKRYATSGSIYTYVNKSIGRRAGFVAGSSIFFAYITTAVSMMGGFAIYLHNLLAYFNLSVPYYILAAIGIISVWFMAQRGVELSTRAMMVLEMTSVSLISILGLIILATHHFDINPNNVDFTNISMGNVTSGLVLAFFGFVGFEGAASMGKEAKKPLRNVPRAVMISPIIAGVFFIIMSMVMIMGFNGSGHNLGTSTNPLSFLSEANHVGFFGYCITLGATISFWSGSVGIITAGSRIMMRMGHEHYLPKVVTKVNEKKRTPTISIGILSLLIGSLIVGFSAFTQISDAYDWFSTIAVWGFLVPYLMVTISAPIFLRKLNELKVRDVLMSLITGILLIIPIVGSIYPQPQGIASIFPYIFVGWIIITSILGEYRYKKDSVKEK